MGLGGIVLTAGKAFGCGALSQFGAILVATVIAPMVMPAIKEAIEKRRNPKTEPADYSVQ